MAPKVNTNATKLTSILAWFHKSGAAHSIKDLEKALPSVGSISGMHVKDYLQALVDENKIRVEKIGSGNWYWAFPSDERLSLESAIEKEMVVRNRAKAVTDELTTKIEEAKAVAMDDDEVNRETLMEEHETLENEVQSLMKELEGYKDNDPAVIDKKRSEATNAKAKADKWTDQVIEMESYLVNTLGMARENLLSIKQEVYGLEYSEEEEGLKEL